MGGFLATYLLLRELPVRNFYARCLLMAPFVLSYANSYGFAPLPFIQPQPVAVQNDVYSKYAIS